MNSIRSEREGSVLTLTLDRPPLNVLDIPMIEALGAALDAAAGPPGVVHRARRGQRFSARRRRRPYARSVQGMLSPSIGFQDAPPDGREPVAEVFGVCLGRLRLAAMRHRDRR
jgi:enoyl-CoA hydratase/carnithine racemase